MSCLLPPHFPPSSSTSRDTTIKQVFFFCPWKNPLHISNFPFEIQTEKLCALAHHIVLLFLKPRSPWVSIQLKKAVTGYIAGQKISSGATVQWTVTFWWNVLILSEFVLGASLVSRWVARTPIYISLCISFVFLPFPSNLK